jgi:hypothetical protein
MRFPLQQLPATALIQRPYHRLAIAASARQISAQKSLQFDRTSVAQRVRPFTAGSRLCARSDAMNSSPSGVTPVRLATRIGVCQFRLPTHPFAQV